MLSIDNSPEKTHENNECQGTKNMTPFKLTVHAGPRRTPILKMAPRLRKTISELGGCLLDHKFDWRNGQASLVLFLHLPKEDASIPLALYCHTEKHLDDVLYENPWEQPPLVAESTKRMIATSGILVNIERMRQSPQPNPASNFAIDAIASNIDLKHLALSLAARFELTTEAIDTDGEITKLFTLEEIDKIREQSCRISPTLKLHRPDPSLEEILQKSGLEDFTDVANRMGFTCRETGYLRFLAHNSFTNRKRSSPHGD